MSLLELPVEVVCTLTGKFAAESVFMAHIMHVRMLEVVPLRLAICVSTLKNTRPLLALESVGT